VSAIALVVLLLLLLLLFGGGLAVGVALWKVLLVFLVLALLMAALGGRL